MRRILFFLVMLLLPVVVLAENVSIKSVELVEKGEYVEEKSQPIFNGLSIGFDLKFDTLGDKAKYKVIIKNEENENYFLDFDLNNNSEYIKYEIEKDGTTNIISANNETIIYIIITYNKEVPENLLVNNKYNEYKDLGIKLTNDKKEEVITSSKNIVINPNTGNIVLRINNSNIVLSLYTLLIVLISIVLLIVILRKIRVKKYTNLVLVLFLLIPSIVIAIKEITININCAVEMEKVNLIEFYFDIYTKDSDEIKDTKKYTAREGMTFTDWENSSYNVDNIDLEDNNTIGEMSTCKEVIVLLFKYNRTVFEPEKYYLNSVIIDGKYYDVGIEDCMEHFTIKGLDDEYHSYMAPYDMTLGEWLESEYNVDNLNIEDGSSINLDDIDLENKEDIRFIGYNDEISRVNSGEELKLLKVDDKYYLYSMVFHSA